MKISEKIIQRVCGTVDPKDAEAIARVLNRYSDIKSSISKVKEDIYKENLRHLEELKKLNGAIATLQGTCDHPDTQRHSDPSGNNDSWKECLICGKEL